VGASKGKLSIGKLSIGKLSIGKLSMGKLSIGKLSIGKLSIGKLSIGAGATAAPGSGWRIESGKLSIGSCFAPASVEAASVVSSAMIPVGTAEGSRSRTNTSSVSLESEPTRSSAEEWKVANRPSALRADSRPLWLEPSAGRSAEVRSTTRVVPAARSRA
jgi:hypothetical protein